VKDAKLESKGKRVRVADLGVTLMPGQAVWVSAQAAKNSACLAQLVRIGKVSVSYGERCKVSKVPYRAGRLSRPRKGGLQKALTNQQPPKAGPTAPEVDKIAASAAEIAATKAAESAIAALLPAIQSLQAGTSPSMEDIERSIQRAVRAAVGTVPKESRPHIQGPDEPVYIPTGIVRDDADELDVSSSESESEGLDEAAAALRALRKRK
jgi:hypothetical protein